MATHYEVLGVDPDASHDEVKRAFLDAALRYHPDRLGAEADAAARERAEWRMREINEAWAVLQSPGGRARYDEELAAARASQASSADRGLSWTPAAGASGDTLAEPAPTDSAGDAPGGRRPPSSAPVRRSGRGMRPFLPVIVLGVILLVVLIVAVYASPGARDDDVDVETNEGFAPGTCVVVFTDGTAEAVACSEPSTGRVVSTANELLGCPEGAVAVPLAGPDVLCLAETP